MKLRDFLTKAPPKCERCGICCKSCTCEQGKEDKNGKCIYLKKRGDLHSCELHEKGLLDTDKVGLGRGCNLKKYPDIYNKYKEKYGGR
jgi:hypothetical protein